MRLDLSSAILKATDPKLRTDNWQLNLHVCDIVKRDPEVNGHDAVQMIQRRLEQNDANVILRSLALTVALAENCGSRLQQDISSKAFTSVLYSLIENRTTHHTIKVDVARVVKQLSKSFENDPSLRSMRDTYKSIKKHHPELLSSEDGPNPVVNLPSKSQLSSGDKQQEERDLEEALKLSLQEFETEKKQRETHPQQPQPQIQQQQQVVPVVRKVRAMYELDSNEQDELSFKKGDVIIVMEQVYRDWWRGSLRGKVGIFPLNYVTPISEPTQQELQQEAEQEGVVFQRKSEVDRLHSVLKANSQPGNGTDITQNPEVGNMYASVTPLRPQITKMIGKYAREKDDVASLRQVLSQAEHTYNQLLDQAANTYKPVAPQFAPQQPIPYPPQQQMQAGPQQGYAQPPQMQTASQQGYAQPPLQAQPQFAGYPQQYPSQPAAANQQMVPGQQAGFAVQQQAPYPVSSNPTGQYPTGQYPSGQYPTNMTQ